MEFPDTLHYTEEHEWIRISDDGKTATVGITDHAQSQLGDIVYVAVEPVGTAVTKDDTFGEVEAVKATSDLYMPVSGTIVAYNEEVASEFDSNEDPPKPYLVNEDAYGEGWMIRVELSDPAELDDLLSAEDYQAMVG